MTEWIANLKQVVLVVLACEFLKELLSTDSFRKYVQFALLLFLFLFLISSLFQVDFSLPEFHNSTIETETENLVLSEYETQIANKISEELSKNNLNVQKVEVCLDNQYNITSVTVFSNESTDKIQAVLKGDFPYEVVVPTETVLGEEP